MDIRQQAEQIAKDFNKSIQERTNALLKIDCDQYTNLGKDSTKTEKKEVKANSKFIYKQIKGFNEKDGELLLSSFDE
jgi:hypothetical protein